MPVDAMVIGSVLRIHVRRMHIIRLIAQNVKFRKGCGFNGPTMFGNWNGYLINHICKMLIILGSRTIRILGRQISFKPLKSVKTKQTTWSNIGFQTVIIQNNDNCRFKKF